MHKALYVLLGHPRADRRRVAMTGLSGGGWQTIFFSAIAFRARSENRSFMNSLRRLD